MRENIVTLVVVNCDAFAENLAKTVILWSQLCCKRQFKTIVDMWNSRKL